MAEATGKAAKKAAPAAKAARKKPVRTAPVQKDFATKLDWLAAMLAHEQAQVSGVNAAKVARLDKRIASTEAEINALGAKLAKLNAERAALVPDDDSTDIEDADVEPADESTNDEG
jgi:uncharacterized small protein (DUF1192 family)